METYEAVVTKVIQKGRYGPYFVAISKSLDGSVTVSLKSDCWKGSAYPEPGDLVLLSDLREKQAGWRALAGRPKQPATKQTARSKEKRMTIALTNLNETFYVRQALDQMRVEFFADLYTGKGEVPLPLAGKVAGDDETIHLIDGRHRKHALLSLEAVETECWLQIFGSWADMVVAAVEANWGGAMPQTESDLRHTVKMMLDHGVGRNTLYSKFSFIPRDMMRKFLDQAQADIAAAKMRRALTAVASEEMKASQAAEKFGVDVAALKRKITGERSFEKPGEAQIKSNISNRFKEASALTGKQLGTALKMFESAELTEQGFQAVVSHVRRLLNKVGANVDNYEARFLAMAGKPQAATAAPPASKKAKAKNAKVKNGKGADLGKSALDKMGL